MRVRDSRTLRLSPIPTVAGELRVSGDIGLRINNVTMITNHPVINKLYSTKSNVLS